MNTSLQQNGVRISVPACCTAIPGILLALLLQVLPPGTSPLWAQGIDSALAYFPLAVGNRWQYEFTWMGVGVYDNRLRDVEVVDTITGPDGNLYFVVTSDEWPRIDHQWRPLQYLRVDSATGVVYCLYPPESSAIVRQRLRCATSADSGTRGVTWIGCAPELSDTVLGVYVRSRMSELALYSVTEKYAYGLGMVAYHRSDRNVDTEQSTTDARLRYARINGREYGRLQGISDTREGSAVSSVLSIVPNPSMSQVAVGVRVSSSSDVTAELLNGLGTVVAVPFSGMLHPGYHTISVDVSTLPAGVYWCHVRMDGSIVTERVVVVR